jgi:two-component system NtrC family sensor kinase
MNLYILPPLIVSILAFFLGCFVLLKNKESKVNRLFFLESIAISLWLFSDFMMYFTPSIVAAQLWARIAYLGVSFIPPFFFQFANAFIGNKENKKLVFFLYVLAVALTIFVFMTDYLITGIRVYYWGFYPKVGPAHFIYVISVTFMFGAPLISMYKYYRSHDLSAQERNQQRFTFLAFTFVLLACVDFLPKYGVEIYPFGALFVAIWLLLIAYAIVKYRAMDVKFVINKGIIYALTLFLGILPAVLIVYFLQKAFPLTVPIAMVLALSVTLAFLFTKIHPFSERFVQKRLFKTQLNYYQILRKFSADMVTALDLKSLLERFDMTLREAMQVTSVAIYLTGPVNGKYPLTHASDTSGGVIPALREREKENESVDEAVTIKGVVGMAMPHHSGMIPLWKSGDALVAMAYQAEDVLVLGEMEMTAREKANKRLEDAIVQMKEAKAEVCLPLKRDGKMVGIALLGPRGGGRYYSPDDLSLLHTLAQNACVAVQNALMVEEIKRSYQILQRVERLAAMGSLIAGVSHEIRNPLMPISFLMDAVADPAEDKDLLMRLHKYSKQSLRRITNVLDEMDELAKPHTPDLKRADINAVVDDALVLLAAQIKLKKQEVIKEYASLPEAMVDGKRLRQAFADILLNAIEANPEKGRICVRTRQIQLKKTKTQSARSGIQIEIADFGCGIAEGNIERVFDPFFTTKHKSMVREGTGLGLALAHRIVEEHHGSIELRSTVGKGTTVFVNLPVG